jgi:hypothetical protein
VRGRPLGGVLLLGALTLLWGGNWPAMKLAWRFSWASPAWAPSWPLISVELTPTGRETRFELRVLEHHVPGLRTN